MTKLKLRFMIQVLRSLNLLLNNKYVAHMDNEDLIRDLEIAIEEEKS